LTPYEATVLKELAITAEFAKTELSAAAQQEFLREFAGVPAELMCWAFREHRRRSPYMCGISDIHAVLAEDVDRRRCDRAVHKYARLLLKHVPGAGSLEAITANLEALVNRGATPSEAYEGEKRMAEKVDAEAARNSWSDPQQKAQLAEQIEQVSKTLNEPRPIPHEPANSPRNVIALRQSRALKYIGPGGKWLGTPILAVIPPAVQFTADEIQRRRMAEVKEIYRGEEQET
jgi:hypothetical protein